MRVHPLVTIIAFNQNKLSTKRNPLPKLSVSASAHDLADHVSDLFFGRALHTWHALGSLGSRLAVQTVFTGRAGLSLDAGHAFRSLWSYGSCDARNTLFTLQPALPWLAILTITAVLAVFPWLSRVTTLTVSPVLA